MVRGDKMMLKGRLKLLYDMIPPCNILSDIGTDHGLLPAFAVINQKCQKAIACDVREGPLKNAQKTLEQFKLEGKMELRLGNGLEPITEDEADCIVIAGMGGLLITEILSSSMNKARRAENIILQPMKKQEELRTFLWRNGFEILDESLAMEGEKLYQALKARYTGSIREQWDPLDEVIGKPLIEKKDPLLPYLLKSAIIRQEKILKGIKKARLSENRTEREKELLDKLKKLLASIDVSG